ncbi:hypothetical protein TNIN_192421 [Trichonephila inaurata madagascariensis]|uniref:Uncharacterized protein n=1 Tax=Trichonephila inaurata madagascariensis TaxID=2747483 RepID=A0A8X6YQ65_9ARAC|nr:hypothetical protein TNIN_192421 [Trichonephila inaurata madagascariensis]
MVKLFPLEFGQFCVCDPGYTIFPEYCLLPAMNSGRFKTFHSQKLDTTSLFVNHQILQGSTIISPHAQPRQLDDALYKSLCSLLRMLRSPPDTPFASLDVSQRSSMAI